MPLSRQHRQVLTMLVTVLAVVVLWWFQAQGEDVPTSGRDSSSSSEAAAGPDRGDREDGSGSGRRTDPDSGLPIVTLADLPPEAGRTLDLIDAGGPYPHDEDDGVFGNFEGILPDQQRGYYREYTVETPGLDHRGARRIVAGSGGELYWTDDHYSSFSRIDR